MRIGLAVAVQPEGEIVPGPVIAYCNNHWHAEPPRGDYSWSTGLDVLGVNKIRSREPSPFNRFDNPISQPRPQSLVAHVVLDKWQTWRTVTPADRRYSQRTLSHDATQSTLRHQSLNRVPTLDQRMRQCMRAPRGTANATGREYIAG